MADRGKGGPDRQRQRPADQRRPKALDPGRMPRPETTTLWDFPSQHYGGQLQGDPDYKGATPSWIIWNLLERYTRKGDLVVDPMCGSGTTLDVARDLGRRALGYDIAPPRADVFRADARRLPLESGKADFVFIDPPYSTHIKYSGDPGCIGELDARGPAYFEAIDAVLAEAHRILRDGRFLAVYVSDSFEKGKPFVPLGFRVFSLIERRFTPVDVVAVKRRNKTMLRNHWHTSALEGNYFLRGFNYLFIARKGGETRDVGPVVEGAALGPRPRPAGGRGRGRPGG